MSKKRENPQERPVYKDELNPPIRWYGVALMVFMSGAGVIAFYALTEINLFFKSMVHVKAPGEKVLVLPKAAPYAIFHEYSTVYEEKGHKVEPDASDAYDISIFKVNGEEVPIKPVVNKSPYDVYSRAGVGLYMFRIDTGGSYKVVATVKPGVKAKEVIFAISSIDPSYEIGRILSTCAVIFFATFALGGTSWGVVYFMRQRDKARKGKK